ncbi:effector-associated constant component EACC1 [Nocardia transvalensis]|uniref:effector-associated constant component EACC1 n=1 Tax=Nocardia transvalensis TaxID=37333 RepID=UPI001894B91C|nr:hypothetical protein [Nocardia transvalensis]MBF6332037.1 hypothetical protein [Nocardia transvalensis]
MRLNQDRTEEVLALYEWLRREPEFRGRVRLLGGGPEPGEMGAVTDILLVALGGGGALTMLASSLKVFFAQPRRSDLEITIETPEGRRISVTAERVADPEALVRQVLEHGDAE